MLDEFCQTMDVGRKAAVRLLAKPTRLALVRGGRPARYGSQVTGASVKLWEVDDRMRNKLLASLVPDLLASLKRHAAMKVSPDIRVLLLQISSLHD